MRKESSPLLLTLPLLMLMMLFLLLDTPNPVTELQQEPVEQSTQSTQQNTKEEVNAEPSQTATQDNVNPTSPSTEQSAPPALAETPEQHVDVLTVLVGTQGSMEGGSAKVYDFPDESSDVLCGLQYNCAVFLKDEQLEEEWYYVDLIPRGAGWVKRSDAELCTIRTGSSDPVRDEIIHNALKYLGTKFKTYGMSLTDGIDCPNYVCEIYKLSDIDVPNTALELRDAGILIDEADAQPGDLVFYDKANGGEGHVGLYLGDGFIINSAGHAGKHYPEGGVRICRLLYADRDSYQIYDLLQGREEEVNGTDSKN